MPGVSGVRRYAVSLSLLAALLWASYYIFVLSISPATRPSAIVVYPFVFGGVAYAIWAFVWGAGPAFLALWRDPWSYVRTSLLVVMQLAVLSATYLLGPVDSALLSLIGDVVATPIIVAILMGLHRDQVRSPWFAAGLVLSVAGGTLAIVGGQSLMGIPPEGWIVVPTVPLAVAFYFFLSARANESLPISAVVGQPMLAAALVSLLITPAIPGGLPGLVPPSAFDWLALAALGLTSFFFAFVLYFAAIRRAGLVLPPMLMTGIPVFTLILSALILRIAIPIVAALGIPVAVVGGLLALRGASSGPLTPAREPGEPAVSDGP
jgi:drug/metabolite transporter (DMT)-like permease